MKTKCLVIGIMMGFAFAACSPSVKVVEPVEMPTTELATIDSLMWRQPDSALAQLQRFAASPAADSLDAFNGHYCQMLISELLYKNYYGQSNREGLLHAVDYFDSLTANTHTVPQQERNVFLDARAHYINGVGFYEKGDVVQACAEYLKALELMEGCFEEKTLTGKRAQFMANTYNRLGDLFSEQFMMESSITCYENALVYCKIEPTSPIGVSNILYRIGKQYDKKNEIENARLYYSQALDNMTATDNMVYRDIVASKALCDYQLNGIAKQSLDELNRVLFQAKTEKERLNRNLTIGCIFFYEDNYDSALYYLEPVFENREAGLQDQAANYMYIIYNKQGDRDQADSLMHFLASRKKLDGENKALVSKLEGMFQQHLQWKQEKAEAERREAAILRRIKIIVVTVVFVAVAVLMAWLFHRRKMRQQRDKASQQIEAERAAHRLEKASMSGRLKRSNEELRGLKDQIKQQNEDSSSKGETQAATFMDEPICRLIMERVRKGQFKSQMDYTLYKDYALSKEQLIALREAVNRHYDHFIVRLVQTYPDITKSDLDYCCLYLLDLTDADISALMQRAYNTVNERNSKLKKILGCQNTISVALHAFADGRALY